MNTIRTLKTLAIACSVSLFFACSLGIKDDENAGATITTNTGSIDGFVLQDDSLVASLTKRPLTSTTLVSNARVFLVFKEDTVGIDISDSHGMFSFDSLEAGLYQLVAKMGNGRIGAVTGISLGKGENVSQDIFICRIFNYSRNGFDSSSSVSSSVTSASSSSQYLGPWSTLSEPDFTKSSKSTTYLEWDTNAVYNNGTQTFSDNDSIWTTPIMAWPWPENCATGGNYCIIEPFKVGNMLVTLKSGSVRYSTNQGKSWRDTTTEKSTLLSYYLPHFHARLDSQWVVASATAIYLGHPLKGFTKVMNLPNGNPYTAPKLISLTSNGNMILININEPEQGGVIGAIISSVTWRSTNGKDWERNVNDSMQTGIMKGTSGGFLYSISKGVYFSQNGKEWQEVQSPVHYATQNTFLAGGRIVRVDRTAQTISIASTATPTQWVTESHPLFQYITVGYVINNKLTVSGSYGTTLRRDLSTLE